MGVSKTIASLLDADASSSEVLIIKSTPSISLVLL